jgi:hypothetical protein
LVAWDEAKGKKTYEAGTSDDIFKFPATAKTIWTKEGSDYGISVSAADKGFIPIAGITVTGVGIEQLTMDDGQLKIYPNPTTGELTIENGELSPEFNSGVNVDVYDVFGRNVLSHQLSTVNCQLSIKNLPSGIYFIRMQTENEVIIRKIVKN